MVDASDRTIDRSDAESSPRANGSGAEAPVPSQPVYVGIGASAGGLEAIRELLGELPADTGMVFLVVQHLDPRRESKLVAVLSKATSMTVVEAEHGLRVEPNRVFVIPPASDMTVVLGTIVLTPRTERSRPHLPIDMLFRSLARAEGSRPVGVVLSGTGADGALGIAEIKGVGGVTLVQSPDSAQQPGMPTRAIESGAVDFVLPPKEIARQLTALGRHPFLIAIDEAERKIQSEHGDFQKVLGIVRAASGVDFTQYRDSTIRRRILRRMALHSISELAEYRGVLERDRDELDALFRDLLIHVTSFFRDPGAFEALTRVVFPEILRAKSARDPIRIWVPGCSTGQEAYSIAIVLLEFLDTQPIRPPVQIFATDLADPGALHRARAGLYPESIEAEVSPQRLQRFFRKEGDHYRVEKSIRDCCTIARQDMVVDPPFSRLDLISCRNVLIYLGPALQRRVIPTFHYALNTPGFLLLGNFETVGESAELFEPADRLTRVYRKKPSPRRTHPVFHSDERRRSLVRASEGLPPSTPQDFQREADRILIGRFAPPGVLVDENLDVLTYRGQTGPYLETPPGEPTTQLYKLVREGLFLGLRSAIEEARKTSSPVRQNGVCLRQRVDVLVVDIEVFPVKPRGAGDGCFLILFHDATDRLHGPGAKPEPERPPVASAAESAELGIEQLRRELAVTKDYMQSLLDQQDSANEQLRSANEEILSSNEEMQSTNEELETAREELQSTNEELTTVNEQLYIRNQELQQLINDQSNLLASTSIPLLMVGLDLRIRLFTAPARTVMSLLPSDVGRPIGDVKPALLVPDLERRIRGTIESGEPHEGEVRDTDGKWYSVRIHPYRTSEARIDGAVLVLVDIDAAKRAVEEIARQSSLLTRQRSLIELSKDAIIVRDAEDRIVFWNRGAKEMYGWNEDEAIRCTPFMLLRTSGESSADEIARALREDGAWEGELIQTRQDGEVIAVYSRQVRVRDDSDGSATILEIDRDVTLHNKIEHELRAANRQKDQFLALVSHELRNPIAPIRNAAAILGVSGDDPQVVAQAKEILDRQVDQLSRIVDDLVDLSRIANQKIELRREIIAVRGAVETSVETCRQLLQSSRHELRVVVPDQPLYVDVDPVRLVQILTNLLTNASKYTEPGGQISIRVSVEPSDDELDGKRRLRRVRSPQIREPDRVAIEVTDSGVGISRDLLPHVFELFTQGVTRSEGTRSDGLGIGLALVRNLVEMHGGTIEARSDGLGHGSTFIVTLPLVAASVEATAPRLTPQLHELHEPRAPRRVLIVDDNADQATSLGKLVELLGHEVKVLTDGTRALEVAVQFEPHVVMLDIGMPGITGLEVARRMRALAMFSKTALIAQSGFGQEEDRQRSAEAGFDLHLVKPIDFAILEELFALPGGR